MDGDSPSSDWKRFQNRCETRGLPASLPTRCSPKSACNGSVLRAERGPLFRLRQGFGETSPTARWRSRERAEAGAVTRDPVLKPRAIRREIVANPTDRWPLTGLSTARTRSLGRSRGKYQILSAWSFESPGVLSSAPSQPSGCFSCPVVGLQAVLQATNRDLNPPHGPESAIWNRSRRSLTGRRVS
jgi:hypothetical protein